MKKFLFLHFFAILHFLSFSQEIKFSIPKDTYYVGEEVLFTNASIAKFQNANFIWNFGDDCSKTPIYIRKDCDIVAKYSGNIIHRFNKPGKHLITLQVADGKYIYSKLINIVKRVNTLKTTTDDSGNNLLANNSFEKRDTCADDVGDAVKLDDWYSPTLGSADLFHYNCCPAVMRDFDIDPINNFAGSSTPKTGSAFIGLVAYIQEYSQKDIYPNVANIYYNYREYISQKLKEPLKANKNYLVQFYTKMSSKSRLATKIGMYISADSIFSTNTSYLPYLPQLQSNCINETEQWVLVRGLYTAKGGESFINIGNFNNDENSNLIDIDTSQYITSRYGGFKAFASFYYLDDVSVIEIDDSKFTPSLDVALVIDRSGSMQ